MYLHVKLNNELNTLSLVTVSDTHRNLKELGFLNSDADQQLLSTEYVKYCALG